MHEFSLAIEVIRLAEREAANRHLSEIQEISIEVGDLSGVEADAFSSALGLLARDSVLDKAEIRIIKSAGTGKCHHCKTEFDMHHLQATCPLCHSFPAEVNGGREFKVLSLLAE